MEVDEILKVLKRIWTRPDQGYVFMPYIPKHMAKTKEDRDRGWTEVKAFDLKDWKRIRAHVAAHIDDELYFTPMVFSRPLRRREFAKATSRLWADLDEADPRKIDPILYPQVAWETSPGRYDAVWFMSSVRPETTERGGENHRLTIAVGADPSGWDTTQLLRVPGSANNKPGRPKGYHGKLLWLERQSHTWESIDSLPELPKSDVVGGDLLDEEALKGVDSFAAWARVKRNLPPLTRQMMRLKEADSTMDRSNIAWMIERDLADAGCSLLEMVAIMRPTPWNKHYGRRDELKRLTLECGKALAQKKEQKHSKLDTDEEVKADILVPFWNNEAYLNAPDPEWLYEEFLPRGGCGLISAIPKSLKTWFAMDLCISASMGRNYLDYQIEKPINVLYVQREDPTTLVRDRHNIIATSKDPKWALSDDPKDVRPYPGALYVETMTAIDVGNEDWRDWLAQQIQQCELDLVVFDTLVRSAPGTDFDNAVGATEVLSPIKDIARENDCAIMFVHHNTKSQSNERAAQNVAGSGQVHAWADFSLIITEKREGFDHVEVDLTHETKYTGTRELTFRMTGLNEGKWLPEERHRPEKKTPAKKTARKKIDATVDEDGNLEIDMDSVPSRPRKGANERLVRAHLKENPDATTQEIVAATGLNASQVNHHLKRIKTRG
ncbi:RecA-like DNA recombinase [Mycobacterium phage JacoRen57]|nr:RecA-like DNA recombinase [Mycobacterium phage JacoRen57]